MCVRWQQLYAIAKPYGGRQLTQGGNQANGCSPTDGPEEPKTPRSTSRALAAPRRGRCRCGLVFHVRTPSSTARARAHAVRTGEGHSVFHRWGSACLCAARGEAARSRLLRVPWALWWRPGAVLLPFPWRSEGISGCCGAGALCGSARPVPCAVEPCRLPPRRRRPKTMDYQLQAMSQRGRT